MKLRSSIALLSLLAFTCPAPLPAALLPVTDNGISWEYHYNPDSQIDADHYDKLPNDINNTHLGGANRYFGGPGGTGSANIVDHFLRTVTSANNKVEYNTSHGYTPGLTDGITVEARFRVVEMTGTAHAAGFVLGAGPEAGANGYWVALPFSTTQLGSVSQLDLTQWTTVRFTIDTSGTGAPTLSIYVNNDPDARYVGSIVDTTSQAGTFNRIRFGDTGTAASTAMDGTVDWDYVRWTSTGAYAPIPEPSVALLPLGALLLFGVSGMKRSRLKVIRSH